MYVMHHGGGQCDVGTYIATYIATCKCMHADIQWSVYTYADEHTSKVACYHPQIYKTHASLLMFSPLWV